MATDLHAMKWLLVDQIHDLTIGVISIRKRLNELESTSISYELMLFKRMCDMHLISSLSKIDEIYAAYAKLIQDFPPEIRDPLRKLKKEIEDKKIYQYRKKYGAHVIDNDTGEPLTLQRGNELMNKIIGENLDENAEFYNWIHSEDPSKNSVLKILINTKDYLLSQGYSGERR